MEMGPQPMEQSGGRCFLRRWAEPIPTARPAATERSRLMDTAPKEVPDMAGHGAWEHSLGTPNLLVVRIGPWLSAGWVWIQWNWFGILLGLLMI